MIEVSHLSKQYGSHPAIENLSFTVEDGQIYGLLGPNGAGKSTIMNILTSYLAPTSGDVRVGDYDLLTQPHQAKRLIGYLLMRQREAAAVRLILAGKTAGFATEKIRERLRDLYA